MVFHVAARNGAINLGQLLLDSGTDIESRSGEYRWTGLHFATKSAHIETMRWLLDRGANTDTKDNEGRTALHLASYVGNTAAVRLLLENGADIEALADWKMRPLHFAVEDNHEDVIVLLLESGADSEMMSVDGTALHYAVLNNYENITRILLEHGANLEAGEWTALHLAASRGNETMVALLLENGANINAQSSDGSPICLAAIFKREEVVRVLVRHGATVDLAEFPDQEVAGKQFLRRILGEMGRAPIPSTRAIPQSAYPFPSTF